MTVVSRMLCTQSLEALVTAPMTVSYNTVGEVLARSLVLQCNNYVTVTCGARPGRCLDRWPEVHCY